MSLYLDATSILTASRQQGSLKSRIYAKDAGLRSKPAHVYALISETSKYDVFLKEVIDNAGILTHEFKLTPLIALLLVHDHFFAKGGIAAGSSHYLRQAVDRHKARLQSEFTKARLKRRIPSIEQLKPALLKEKGIINSRHPRWVRVNALKITLDDHLKQSLTGYERVDSIRDVMEAPKERKLFYCDLNIPDLLAFPPDTDLTKSRAYQDGNIILQDKASCFPAHLLFGDKARDEVVGGAIDGCAAPGNKTTHLAALVSGSGIRLYACERDATRAKTLQMMVDKAGAGKEVTVLSKQDFLALDPLDRRFKQVTHLLLDPSCSGSGIVGRENIPELSLPKDPRSAGPPKSTSTKSNKRKRGEEIHHSPKQENDGVAVTEELDPEAEQEPLAATQDRLKKLSNLQSRIVEHAFTFPAARRITYSTCSIHIEENEAVVARVLNSSAGKSRRWRVLRRDEQVSGLKIWKHRGVTGGHGLSTEEMEACIRCTPDDGEGTMGFFVCGFVRDDVDTGTAADIAGNARSAGDGEEEGDKDADGWEGFSDT